MDKRTTISGKIINENKKEILKLREAGWKIAAIARKFGIGQNYLADRIHYWETGINRAYKNKKKKYFPASHHKLCEDCADWEGCKGENWDSCPYRGK